MLFLLHVSLKLEFRKTGSNLRNFHNGLLLEYVLRNFHNGLLLEYVF